MIATFAIGDHDMIDHAAEFAREAVDGGRKGILVIRMRENQQNFRGFASDGSPGCRSSRTREGEQELLAVDRQRGEPPAMSYGERGIGLS